MNQVLGSSRSEYSKWHEIPYYFLYYQTVAPGRWNVVTLINQLKRVVMSCIVKIRVLHQRWINTSFEENVFSMVVFFRLLTLISFWWMRYYLLVNSQWESTSEITFQGRSPCHDEAAFTPWWSAREFTRNTTWVKKNVALYIYCHFSLCNDSHIGHLQGKLRGLQCFLHWKT